MAPMDELKTILREIQSGDFAREYWRTRPPMTREELDRELASADRRLEKLEREGRGEGVDARFIREHRQFYIDFFDAQEAA